MVTCKTIKEIRDFVRNARNGGKTVGFVPTMGYFHEGHLTLMRTARSENDTVVVSIFVNPTQFGPQEDFAQYPRDLKRDLELAQSVGVDAVFAPEVEEIYPKDYSTYVEVKGLSDKLCGRFRPGHFRGVATVVLKLFNIVQPDRAYFGQKDAQQLRIMQRMTEDLNLAVRIVPVPTVREPDGLAMSSRNVYLSPAEREAARIIPQSLEAARQAIDSGERSAANIVETVKRMLESCPIARIDYVEACRFSDLEPLDNLAGQGEVLLAIAVKIGKTRLIDNIIIEASEDRGVRKCL
ncbi:MAG: pantoate--beta-alanine ligase [Firmicutes bacterium]|nr:pantoate--beta-alanine ligase [Bacillota bacterium]